MIDLHSHILPAVDDGSPDLATSLEMARIAAADGISLLACTPHINAPRYANTAAGIAEATEQLQSALVANDIDLKLVTGADIHLTTDVLDLIRNGTAPTLAGTRYFLLEPSHDVMPPHIDRFCTACLEHGYVPILTHPERLAWINNHYDMICRLDALGVVMQLTAGSITGRFGPAASSWAERMLCEGRVDIIASDAHNVGTRAPVLSIARDAIENRHGRETAMRLVLENPRAIVDNLPVAERHRKEALETSSRKSFFDRVRGR